MTWPYRYSIYTLLFAVALVLLAGYSAGIPQTGLWAGLAIVAHAPSFRPSSSPDEDSLIIPTAVSLVERFRVGLLSLPVLVIWAFAGARPDDPAAGLAPGLMAYGGLTLLLVIGASAGSLSKALCLSAVHVARQRILRIAHRAVRGLDAVRGVLAVSSLGTFVAVLLGQGEGRALLTLGMATIAAFAASAVVVAAAVFTLRAYCRAARGEAARIVAAELREQPLQALVYVGGEVDPPFADTLAGLLGALHGDGLATGVVARSDGATQAVVELQPLASWYAPTLPSLDAFVQPEIKAAFYANLHVMNSHFARFDHFVHVLDASRGALSARTGLPGTVAMFDAIIAPDASRATRWAGTLDADLAARIVVLGEGPAPRGRWRWVADYGTLVDELVAARGKAVAA